MGDDNPTIQERSQDKKPAQQHEKQYDWLKEYQWQKGQSGNPAGKKPGKTMKEFARDFLVNMSEEARIEFLRSVDPDRVWEMAEGRPHQTEDITHNLPQNLIDLIKNAKSNRSTSPELSSSDSQGT